MSGPGGLRDRATVRVPATSANLGPGYDSLGIALDLHDEVTATVTDGPVEVVVEGEGAATVDRSEGHLVLRAMRATYDVLGERAPAVRLHCRNQVPHGRGLGSSAAAVVAGVLLARSLVARGVERLDDDAALTLAARLEGHPDNAAPALRGGLTVAWSEPGGAGQPASTRAVRIEPHPALAAVVLVPERTLDTHAARALLPATVPHPDAAHAVSRVALLVHALTSDLALLLPATEDRLHQHYRRAGMPDTIDALGRLRAAGFAAVVSGAGPSLLVLGSGDELAAAAGDLASTAGGGFTARSVAVDRRGALVVGDPARSAGAPG